MSERHAHPSARLPGTSRGPVRVLLLAASVVAAVALPFSSSVGAVDSSEPTAAAIAWLDREMEANGGTVPGYSTGSTDWGLTADVALARIATGGANQAATVALATRLLAALDEYSTWDDVGPEYGGVRVSGALAKVLLVATSAGLDTSPDNPEVSGIDLETELRGLMQPTGDSAGRFSDRNPHAADNSNGFDQAYALLALSLSGGGVPEPAVGFLVSQQCPGGGFRLVYGSTVGCEADSESDPDATALAVQALLSSPRTTTVEQSLADALGWLLGSQEADGSFAGAPPADGINANSTGLIGQTLRGAGQDDAADAAAAWITGQVQLGESAVGTPAEGEIGAIAYDAQRRTDALADGIADRARDQWRRATSQGLLALGAGLFVGVLDEPPVEPSATTSTTTTTSSTTTSTTTSTTPPSTTPPSTTPPSTTSPSTAAVPAATVGPTVAGEQAASARSGGAQLAATGTDGDALGVAGLSLVALGALAVLASVRMRRPMREAWHWG